MHKTRTELKQDIEDHEYELASAKQDVEYREYYLAGAKAALAAFDLKDCGSDLFKGMLR